MLPPTHQVLNRSSDMNGKRKLVVFLCCTVVFFFWCFFAFSKNNSDTYVSIRKTLDDYMILLQDTRGQILTQIRGINISCQKWDPSEPVIYVITPTYARPVQKAELTRMSHTLMLVTNVHWIIIEDSPTKTLLVENLLFKTTLNFTHLNMPTPTAYKLKANEPNWNKPRGVAQRNAGLQWLRENRNIDDKGVVFFADDDNTYSLQLFEEMRSTKEVSVWPVGLVGGLMVEKPILNAQGKVVGWNSAWRPDRTFAIDMAGFAINLSHLLSKTKVTFLFDTYNGFQETSFLEQLTTRDRLEPKADNCTKVLVWHTRTEAPKLSGEAELNRKGKKSHAGMEV